MRGPIMSPMMIRYEVIVPYVARKIAIWVITLPVDPNAAVAIPLYDLSSVCRVHDTSSSNE
jgi:hypothetical protein